MAQLKDLLVTGPVKLIGSVNFNQRPKYNSENLALSSEVTAAEDRVTQIANNAQTTADGKVSKSGDELTGKLKFNTNTTTNYTHAIDAASHKIKIKTENINSKNYNIIVQNSTGRDICYRPQNTFIQDLGLSQVYNYKGTITWLRLIAIDSAKVGDVYFISGADGNNLTGQSWACKQEVKKATRDDYGDYWQSLGGNVDLSGYVTKDTEQTIVSNKYFSNIYPSIDNSYTLGSTSYKWSNVHAATFTGDLSGNASSATMATQDGNGNVINDTYFKLAGGTINGAVKILAADPLDTQPALLKVLSTNNASSNAWVGRMMVGAKNLTFLMGTYNGMAGLGAHSWTDSSAGTGAAWAPLYINPDGSQPVFIGANGGGWLPNTATLIVAGSPNTANTNKGTVTVNGSLKLISPEFVYNSADKCIDIKFN